MGLGLHSAIHTASTGMKAAEKTINVSGTNLANANTIGYKAERADFASFLSYTYRYGSTPGMIHTAGSNPMQIGMGTELAGVTTDFTQGSFQEGMTASDIAINGNGFLIVRPEGSTQQYYTRNGALKINPNFDLTTNTGLYVMGYGIDDQFRIQTGPLTNLKIPVGEMHIAQQTQNTTLAGILDAVGDASTQGTVLRTAPMTDLSKSSPVVTDATTIEQVIRPAIEGYTQTAASAAGGEVEAGKYVYRFTFVDADGVESDYSSPTDPVEVGAGQNSVNLTNLPDVGRDYSSLRIYRAEYSDDPNASLDYFFVSDIDPAATGNAFTDTRSTASISDPTQPDYDRLETDRLAQGSYTYYVTYTDAMGNESVPKELGTFNLNSTSSGGGGQLLLSDIPTVDAADNPDGWTGRRVYRSSASDPTDIHLVGEIRNMNASETLLDRMPDAQLVDRPVLNEAGRGNTLINESTKLIDLGKYENNMFVKVFEEGVLTLHPNKGGENLKTATLDITADTTVGDYLKFLNEAYGIRSTADGVPADRGAIGSTINGGSPGATVIDGSMYFLGNSGEKNALEIKSGDMILKPTNGDARQVNLGWGQDPNNKQDAVGVGAATDLVVYDSLGAAVEVRLTMVLESKSDNETVYRWFADSGSNQPAEGSAIATGMGLLRFDQDGKLISASNTTISVERTDVASVSPLDFDFDMNVDALMALATGAPELTQTEQDGAGAGTLFEYEIQSDGIIMGYFTSGVSRPLGQIPLATFRNQEGLYKSGDSLYQAGTNSGDPIIVEAGTNGVGSIKSNSIELSNSDIGQEIINMILASAMYRSNAKVMTTSNEMFDALLRII